MKPTVLIFLKAPVVGQVKTRLARGVGDEEALAIYRHLVERQMGALPEDWPVEIHYTPVGAKDMMREWLGERARGGYWPQVEGGLGERLAHATKEAFARGASAVVLIGGDCPELGEAELREAAMQLAVSDVVLGPTRDGGYYLLGMKQPHLGLFEGIAWGTSQVAESTRAVIREQGWTKTELLLLRDVDTQEDWAALRDHR